MLFNISMVISLLFEMKDPTQWQKAALVLLILSLLANAVLAVLYFTKRRVLVKRIVAKRINDIEAKNQALLKQKDELKELNELLEKRQKRIENQSLDLKKNEEELEQLNDLLTKRQKRLEAQSLNLKKNEEELEQLNELLEKRQIRIENQAIEFKKQAEELKETNATKDKLFSIISHDLKSPFNTILGFTELISVNFDHYDKEKLKELNETLYQTAKHIYKLLENLLSWSRLQMGSIKFEPENVNLHYLVNEVIVLLSTTASSKNIKLINDVDDKITMKADKNMLHTILRNLVGNSIKFTENGSINIMAEDINGDVKITITDTGVGMEEEAVRNLFVVSKAKSKNGTKGEKGTGLGLILCKEFVVKHGGKIWATSRPGKGSNFFIVLPH